MFCFSGKLSEDSAMELSGFHKIRAFSDGIDYFKFDMTSDWFVGDHNPQFGIVLTIMNFVIFEFRIYNVNHVREP
jgi:hypothetical protein